MNGLDLAKENSLKICECTIDSDIVACEISLSEIENFIKEKSQNSNAIFLAWQIQNFFSENMTVKNFQPAQNFRPKIGLSAEFLTKPKSCI